MINAVSNELFMFYNVENFFPPDNKSFQNMEENNSGLWNWDQRKYNSKLTKIAHVFQLIKEENNQTIPFLIGLSEVQGKKVLEDLVATDPFNSNFGIVHFDSMDERGIDVALLYDKSKIEIIHSESITFFFENEDKRVKDFDTTRDVLFCKVKFRNNLINVFVLHLPSKRENDVNKPKRDYIVKKIKEKIMEIIINNKGAVIVCGDFNENPDDENLTDLVLDEQNNNIMTNPFLNLFQDKIYSTFHHSDGLLFDQIILSQDFFIQNAQLSFSEAFVFSNEKLKSKDKNFQDRPFRTYAGTRYLGGYSDHFPVFVKFKTNLINI